MHRISLALTKKKFFIFLVCPLIFGSCLDIKSCNQELTGKYYCSNNKNAINYLDINADGTFYHFYKEKGQVLSHSGSWEKSDNGYCQIEFSEWKTFNVDGLDFKELGNGILFISKDYLDATPDGNSLTSFKKNNNKQGSRY